jgi:hypothetical protein
MNDLDGPILRVQNCCPGLLHQSSMLEDRVEGRLDFSGVEYVVCSDDNIRQEHFPEVGWAVVDTYCVPADIHVRFERLDCMVIRDLEQLERDKDEFRKRFETEEDKPILMYQFKQGRWVVKSVWLKNRKPKKRKIDEEVTKYLWLVCILLVEESCYAPIVAAIRNGVAPV